MTATQTRALLKTSLFKINDIQVDAQKGIISIEGASYTVEPKVMDVLIELASKPNELVEQEALFKQVWPSSVFSPNSIRRCIAVLRKIFSNSQNTQNSIVTHPKKGYSLNASIELVNSNTQSVSQNQLEKNTTLSRSIFRQPVTLSVIALFTLLFLITLYFLKQKGETLQIVEQRALTVSSSFEFNGKYSPSGKKVAFIRADKNNTNRSVWLIDLTTEKQTRLTAKNQYIRDFTWSPDGLSIAFINKNNQLYTTKLNSLSLITSITQLTDYKPVSAISWGNNHTLYYLAQSTTEPSSNIALVTTNLENGDNHTLHLFEQTFLPYALSLSNTRENITLAGFNQQGETEIKKFDIRNGNVTHIATLDKNRYFIHVHEMTNSIMLSDGRKLSYINVLNEYQPINFVHYDFIQYPQFSPDGSEVLISHGQNDIDIHSIQFNPSTQTLQPNSETILVDTNNTDRAAALSADKQNMAYISHQKGYAQLYLYQFATGKTSLLYRNEQQLLGLSAPLWHPSALKIAFANYDTPYVVELTEKGIIQISSSHDFGVPFKWHKETDSIYTHKKRTGVISQLTSQQTGLNLMQALTPKQITTINSFNRHNEKLTHLLKAHLGTTLKIQAIHEEQDSVYALVATIEDEQQQKSLWYYDEKSNQIALMGEMPTETQRISGVTDSQVIFEVSHAKKNLVRLKVN